MAEPFAVDTKQLEGIVTAIVRGIVSDTAETQRSENLLEIPVGVSNRHIHLCRKDMDILFGEGYEMTHYRDLTQKGFFAARETVVVAGPRGAISGVRLLGPLRGDTQLELLLSDARTLGISAPIRDSGVMGESPLITIVGPRGTVLNNTGVIVAWRHIHMQTNEAKVLGLKDGDFVKVQTMGDRSTTFNNVRIRIGDAISTEIHLDIDEANGADLKTGDLVRIIP